MSKHNNRKTQSLIGLLLAVIISPSQVSPTMSVRAMIGLALGFQVSKPVLKKVKPRPSVVLKDLKQFLAKIDSDQLALTKESIDLANGKKLVKEDFVDEAREEVMVVYAQDEMKAQAGAKNYVMKYDPKEKTYTLAGDMVLPGAATATPITPIVLREGNAHYTAITQKVDELTKQRFEAVMSDPSSKRNEVVNINRDDDLTAFAALVAGDDGSADVDGYLSQRSSELSKIDPFKIKTIDEDKDSEFEVPNAWRRLALLAEGEVVWFLGDWFSIGPKVGIEGNLLKMKSKDHPDVSISTPFSIKAGLTMGFSKWFLLDAQLALTRGTFNKDQTSSDSDATATQSKDLREAITLLKEVQGNLDSNLYASDNKIKNWMADVNQLDLDKSLGERYSFSGWFWSVVLRPALRIWLNEIIGFQVGLEWKIPVSEFSGKEDNKDGREDQKVKPGSTLSPSIAIVFALI